MKSFNNAVTVMFVAFSLVGCNQTKETRKIVTSGFASAEFAADQLNATILVETKGKSASSAMDDNKASVTQVMTILESSAAFVKAVKKNTTQFGELQPWRSDVKKNEEYRASTTISFIATDLSKYDSISRQFANISGASIVRSDFSLSSEIEKRDAVRKTALEKSKEKASNMAGYLGMKIGHPLSITEGPRYDRYMGPSAVLGNSVMGDVNISSKGSISVDAHVDVEYEMMPSKP